MALPLANLFGPEALKYRLQDSGAKAVITDRDNREKIQEIQGELQNLEFIIQTDENLEKDELSWKKLLEMLRMNTGQSRLPRKRRAG